MREGGSVVDMSSALGLVGGAGINVYVTSKNAIIGLTKTAALERCRVSKLLDHNGIVWNCWTGALADLGKARANAQESRSAQGADADAAR